MAIPGALELLKIWEEVRFLFFQFSINCFSYGLIFLDFTSITESNITPFILNHNLTSLVLQFVHVRGQKFKDFVPALDNDTVEFKSFIVILVG